MIALAAKLGRAKVAELFTNGAVTLRDASGRRLRARKGERAAVGTIIELALDEAALDDRAVPDAEFALAVVLERADLVIVEKAAGVPSAPLVAGELGTLANGLVARFPEMASVGFAAREPGLCHRLDTGTSGLLVAARTELSFTRLVGALRSGAIDKRYLCVCEVREGAAFEAKGTIRMPLVGHPTDSRRVVACDGVDAASARGARPAETSYRVLQRNGTRALVEACATRAFRHQIRVHFSQLGAPLVGDVLYGGPDAGLDRYALHASHLSYAGDGTAEPFSVDSPLPETLARLV